LAEAASPGIWRVGLDWGVRFDFGLLTAITAALGGARAAPGPGNKGREAAAAALEMTRLLRRIPGLRV
jgi:6,7-dimethyl-8-ribityllumazine synthase